MQACEVDKSEEVFDVIFPSGDEAAEVVHPGEEPFHLPASFVTAEHSPILCLAPSPPVGRDHLDTVIVSQFLIERIRVVGLIADQPRREFIEEASGKNLFHKLAFGRRSALDRYGERKTVISGDSDDLRALAATGGANGKAPFLALAKVASTNASSRFSLPCACKCVANSFRPCSSFPFRIQPWNRRWQV